MQIIDSHHHIWRQADLPWLQGPMQPRIFGPYEPLRRDYPIEEYRADIAGCDVVKSVYVQANWPEHLFEEETRWVQETADRTGWPHGIVGYADMTAEDAGPQLARLARYDRMRGVRQQFHWHETPLYRFAATPDLCAQPQVRRNIRKLADHGWTFDLQVFASQMEGAAELAAACPDVTFVLQHAGMPEDLSESGWSDWGEGMRRLADQPNVVTKLSAFGTFVHRLDADLIARIIQDTVALFGAQRCMWGSNFPIEKLWTSYDALLAAHIAATEGMPHADRAAIFHDTATRVYRL